MWNNLGDSNKQPYLIKANKLKDKYQKDVADYKGKAGRAGASKPKKKPVDDDDDDEDEDDEEDEDEEEDDDDDDDD
ncbi:hypothetical protein AGOR_G00019290 [Albula goreensis]|uniref:HMG box domain-containing protein n=1 Tax=Albula goreensis TaxID=1534307 RepID=A0A8T3E535_9TELE|nr:hypothetical protein AGOR_G00019290 [Albula goreensis]